MAFSSPGLNVSNLCSLQNACHLAKYVWYCLVVPDLHDAMSMSFALDESLHFSKLFRISGKPEGLVFATSGELRPGELVALANSCSSSSVLVVFSLTWKLLRTNFVWASLAKLPFPRPSPFGFWLILLV